MVFEVPDWELFFEKVLFTCNGTETSVQDYSFFSSGNFSTSAILTAGPYRYFLKWHENGPFNSLAIEAENLRYLASKRIRVPAVLGNGKTDGKEYLLLEYLDQSQVKVPDQALAVELQAMHSHKAKRHGFDSDGFLWGIPLSLEPMDSGVAFFGEQHLLKLAGAALLNEVLDLATFRRLERLIIVLSELIPEEPASLLHGNMNTQHVLYTGGSEVCFLNPSCYYGLREVELAQMILWGGFDTEIIIAYNEVAGGNPLQPNFEKRLKIYNLFPLLIMINKGMDNYVKALSATLDTIGF